MNDRDELPQWTAGPQGRMPVVEQRSPNRGRAMLLGLLGLAVLVGMGVAGWFLAQQQSDDTSAGEDVAGPVADDETDGDAVLESSEADDALTVDIDDEPTDSTDGDTDDSAQESADNTDDDSGDNGTDGATVDASTRTAVFRGGKLYLGGKVPSQDIADLIASKAAAVVGPDNVVVEYEIDPTVVIDPGESTPLYVEDVVLFQFNSVSIDPPFYPLLDLGTLLLLQNPQATLTVVTRTDAVGSEAVNLDVATRRAQAVIDYWLAQGVNPDQLVADPRGEEGASEDDDEQTAALQRRAEFIITGLLD